MHKFQATKVLTPAGWIANAIVTTNQGKIHSVVESEHKDKSVQQLNGYLIPGFVDVQVNGGGGLLFNQHPTLDCLNTMMHAHSQYGTTAMLPTLITDDFDVFERGANAVAEALNQGVPGIIGIHFEGPHLNIEKRGVHPKSKIRAISQEFVDLFCRSDIGKVMVTLAPDQVAPEQIESLVKQGVVVSLGHSNASTSQVLEALQAGALGFTHLYNAMSPLQSREPGMVGVALADTEAYCGLILDHHHVHPLASKLAYQCKGAERLMLVTDAMSLIGTDLTETSFFDTRILREGNKLATPEGTLAGSHLNMLQAVVNAHRDLDIPLQSAIAMASSTPANFLGLTSEYGAIVPGAKANMLLVDERLQIQRVWLEGSHCHSLKSPR